MPKLILKRKAEVLQEFSLRSANATYSIGSDPGNDLVINDKLVSMTHLYVERQGNQYFIRDLKSAFGTLVNGEHLAEKIEIRDGDTIQIGDHTLIFKNPLENSKSDPKAKPRQAIEEFWGDIKNSVFASPKPSNGEAAEAELRVVEQAEALVNQGGNISASRAPAPKDQQLDDDAATPQVQVVEKSPYYFLSVYGPYLGKKYQLNFGETRIGRDVKLNDIVIRQNKKGEVDPSVSRRHATVSYRDGGFFITDKRSQSRTYVNDHCLSETDEVQLIPGDEVEIVSDQQSTIFRFVSEGNWDFKLPRKAAEWYIRYRSRAFDVLTAALFLIGGVVGFQAARGWMMATEKPQPFKVTHQQFARSETGAEANSFGSSVGAEAAPAPVAHDFNGDRFVDFAYAQANGVLIAMDGRERRRLWQASGVIVDPSQPLSVADLNANGLDDLVAITGDGRLAGIDGLYGAEMWTSPIFESSPMGPAVAGDFDRDGWRDVAVITTNDKLQIGYSRVNSLDWVEIDLGVSSRTSPSAADLNRDGAEEILIATDNGLLLIYNGLERRISETIDANEALNKAKGSFDQVYEIRHPVAIADLSGDGAIDLVLTTTRGQVLCIDGATRRTLWWAEAMEGEGNAPAEGASSLGLGDIDQDGRPDVILACSRGLYAFRGSRSDSQREQPFWEIVSAPQTRAAAPMALFDFNRDLAADVARVQDGRPQIISGVAGEMLWEGGNDLAVFPGQAAPLVADFAKDGYLDVLLPDRQGDAHLFATNRRVQTAKVMWGQRFTSAGHASLALADASGSGKFLAMLALAIVLPIGTLAGNLTVRRRRKALAAN